MRELNEREFNTITNRRQDGRVVGFFARFPSGLTFRLDVVQSSFTTAMSAENSVCATCHKPSTLRCGRCRRVAYCSKDHQKIDWKIHKQKCGLADGDAYKIEKNEKLGRHLIAARVILEGEIILEEPPLVSGPLQLTQPVCLGCYDSLNQFNSRDCTRCGWPVCSAACENSESHKPECEITEKYKKSKVVIKTFESGLHHPSYQCITVLRCLYLKNADKNAWEKISRLESHWEERKKTKKYEEDLVMVAKFIHRFFGYVDFTEEEILRMAGIVQVNGHLIPLKEPGYVSLYDKASLIEHNCRANCCKSFSQDGRIVIRAARTVQTGEHLSISYTEPLWGLQARREHLLETKYFCCECERCTDPTELGTHFNSIRCIAQKCDGYMVPTSTSISLQWVWQCVKCGKNSCNEMLRNLFTGIKNDLHKLDRHDPEKCKEFLEKNGRYLHPNHYLVADIKLALLQSFEGEKLTSASEDDLNMVINICKDLSNLIARLVPAENRLRGVLYFHLHSAVTELDRKKSLCGLVDESQLKHNILTYRDILKRAYSFLSSEPEVLPEGKMAIQALRYIQDINKIIEGNQSI